MKTHFDGCWRDHFACAVAEIERLTAATDGEVQRLRATIERDRAAVADARRVILQVLGGHDWLATSRGAYAWDDDQWHGEFRRAWDAMYRALEPLERIAADWTDCPTMTAEVHAARAIPRDADVSAAPDGEWWQEYERRTVIAT